MCVLLRSDRVDKIGMAGQGVVIEFEGIWENLEFMIWEKQGSRLLILGIIKEERISTPYMDLNIIDKGFKSLKQHLLFLLIFIFYIEL